MSNPLPISTLRPFLRRDDTATRVFAVKQLARHGRNAKDDVPQIVTCLGCSDPEEQKAAMCALAAIQTGVKNALQSLLAGGSEDLHGDSADVRVRSLVNALNVLHDLATKEDATFSTTLVATVIGLLEDPVEDIRYAATLLLGVKNLASRIPRTHSGKGATVVVQSLRKRLVDRDLSTYWHQAAWRLLIAIGPVIVPDLLICLCNPADVVEAAGLPRTDGNALRRVRCRTATLLTRLGVSALEPVFERLDDCPPEATRYLLRTMGELELANPEALTTTMISGIAAQLASTDAEVACQAALALGVAGKRIGDLSAYGLLYAAYTTARDAGQRNNRRVLVLGAVIAAIDDAEDLIFAEAIFREMTRHEPIG